MAFLKETKRSETQWSLFSPSLPPQLTRSASMCVCCKDWTWHLRFLFLNHDACRRNRHHIQVQQSCRCLLPQEVEGLCFSPFAPQPASHCSSPPHYRSLSLARGSHLSDGPWRQDLQHNCTVDEHFCSKSGNWLAHSQTRWSATSQYFQIPNRTCCV